MTSPTPSPGESERWPPHAQVPALHLLVRWLAKAVAEDLSRTPLDDQQPTPDQECRGNATE